MVRHARAGTIAWRIAAVSNADAYISRSIPVVYSMPRPGIYISKWMEMSHRFTDLSLSRRPLTWCGNVDMRILRSGVVGAARSGRFLGRKLYGHLSAPRADTAWLLSRKATSRGRR